LGHVERPDSGAGADVQNLARVDQRGQVGTFVKEEVEDVVLEVESLILGLEQR